MYVHTHKHMYTHTHVQIHTCTYTQTHVQMYMHICIRTPPPIKSCSTSLFTHRAGYCTLGGGREHSTHSFLCFHCAQLLSSLTAPQCQ
ncbi:unnamed protein product [Staurois parvus]|uniref:Uncharacterized protein n=1 Tax=Staurois parvus TaxID=386267 RepID=A0ABN9EKB2_9NEOB|nr:unnamed protein product [Staurois parvus]